jgi:protein-L-isoaspartate(D-aspartate) O-methyltransferase
MTINRAVRWLYKLAQRVGQHMWHVPASRPTDAGARRRSVSNDQTTDDTGDSESRMGFLLGLRRRGIVDQTVLRAMDEVPREHFVTREFVDAAYADQALPIACGQTISQPYVVAYMTEQLELQPHHRVLEVGTGSGYQAAVLSRLAREVVTVERYRTLADASRARLDELGYRNVTVLVGDGLAGVPGYAPYDRIIVTAAAETIPDALLRDLVAGGVMILPLGPHSGPQRIVKLTNNPQGTRQDLLWVRFVPLLPGQAREL